MSILSPVAAAIINNIQANTKADGKTDSPAFLALLENSNSGFSASNESEQSLVDALSVKEDVPPPAPQPQTAASPAEPRQAASAPSSAARNGDGRNKDKPGAPAADRAKQQDNVPQKNAKPSANDNANAKEAPRQEAPAVNAKSNAVDKPAATSAKASGADDAVDEASLADKLRGKIEELSNILSALAAMLGVGNVVQVTVTKVTQTTLTLTQQSLGVNQPFIDLSDRFDKLIAAVTASQNLPSESGASLGATFASFQQLLVSMSTTNSAADTTPLLANCAACETDLSAALENVQLAKGDKVDTGQLADQLQKLGQWLNSVQALVAPKVREVAVQEAVVAASVQLSALSASQTAHANFSNASKAKPEEGALLSAVATTSAPVSSLPSNVAPTHNAVVAAAIAVNASSSDAGVGANLSGNNNGGQGGERPAAVTNITGPGTASHTNSVGASTFSKVLKAQNSTPVVEQVAFNIKTAVKDGASRIQIQLDPVELGKLHIKIDLSADGKATGIVVTADQKSTLDMLQRDARGLESALADAGIKAESGSLSFNLRGGEGGKEEAPKSPRTAYVGLPAEEDTLAPLAVISRSYVVNTTDGLDIQI